MIRILSCFAFAAAAFSQEETLPLSLEQAQDMALRKNLELERVEVEGEATRFEQLGSWGSFDWVFDASIGFTDAEREVGGFLDGGLSSVESESTDYQFSFLRPLTTGGSFTARFDRGLSESTSSLQNDPEQTTDTLSFVFTQPLMRGYGKEVATSNQQESELVWRKQVEVVRQTRLSIAQRVSDAYWDLVSAYAQVDVARSAVALGESRLDQELKELEAEVGTEIDVVQARAELATRKESLLQAENDVADRQDDLRKLLSTGGEDGLWDTLLEPTTGLPQEIVTDFVPAPETAVQTALEMRPELKQKQFDIRLAEVRLVRARSDQRSGLDFNLTAASRAVDSKGSQAFEDASAFEFPSYSATLSYNMVFGNRTARNATQAARARVRAAALDYDLTELDVTAEVRAAVRGVHFAASHVEATTESLRFARQQLENEEERLRHDLSTNLQVLEFQQSLIEAMSNERTARAQYAKALVALKSAQGVLGESKR